MTDILNEITARRLRDIEAKTVTLAELKSRHRDRDDIRPFRRAIQVQNAKSKVQSAKCRTENHFELCTLNSELKKAAIIAEIKRGSPAKGLFAPHLDPAECAKDYERGGAACLSVLTEPHWFFGATEDLIAARSACALPVLQKDFIVTEYQVFEAAVYADCMLLIARCLERRQLIDLHGLATELGLEVLVEVFDEEDIDKIEGTGAITPLHVPLIGVNHRNLRTMRMDFERSQELVSRFASDQTIVAASGIRTRRDIEHLMRTGFHAFLVGESLSTSSNRVEWLRQLVQGGEHAEH